MATHAKFLLHTSNTTVFAKIALPMQAKNCSYSRGVISASVKSAKSFTGACTISTV